ncbi:hypothetical protein K7I13_11545 [Brucepastera parasyntrophica]|uniref:hypothetical protein n=1 Tax=Brucepastera parasyntrophica TaxID=2880008 RepID=UPI00210C9A42|nr:hypothetical protein [Brucepastera parasyntrophica]ULQ59130.1 hypothetical protein K7I13_11545 [Brucepastera parasyntrophica]
MTSHDEHDNVTEMSTYNYDRTDDTKRQGMQKFFFSDYDEAGNWQTLTISVFDNPAIFQRYTRKIVYD